MHIKLGDIYSAYKMKLFYTACTIIHAYWLLYVSVAKELAMYNVPVSVILLDTWALCTSVGAMWTLF